MCMAMSSGIIYVYAHRCTLSCAPTGILYRVCRPVYLIVYANRYTLSCMSTGIPYRVCQPVYLIAYAHRYTFLCMPTYIPFRVCPPVNLIVYAHQYLLSCMQIGTPYRVSPKIHLIVYAQWYPLNAKNLRFSAAIYECQRGEESGRSLSDCLGHCLHRSDARTTAPASRRCSVSSHFGDEYSVTPHVTKNS